MKQSHAISLQDDTVVANCYSKIVKCLLKYECNIEEQLSKTDLNKLLHIAIQKELQSVVKALVKNGADIYYKDDAGNTALALAKAYGNDQIYYSLVHTEVDINVINAKDSTSFLKISVILLILKSFYANYFPTLYCTYELIRKNPIDMALLLINSNSIIKDFFIDVYEAIEEGYTGIINIILSYGTDINIRDKFGRLMLQCACYQGNKNAVQFLLDMGADVNKLDAYQRSPLHIAVVAQQVEIVNLLIKNGANVNARKCGRNLLYSAVDGHQSKGLELIKILVKEGVDVNDALEIPLLHYAVKEDCVEIVEFLLKKGADVNNQNMQGETSLHVSITILNTKGDNNVCLEEYHELYTVCVQRNWCISWNQKMFEKEKMSALLLAHGADVNAINDEGKTPLTLYNIATIGTILLIKHIAKLSMKNVHINDINLKFINKNEKLEKFFSKCKGELKLMKNQILFNSVSLHDVLCETNVNKLAIYVKHKELKDIDTKSEIIKFPIYYPELKTQCIKGKERRNLLDLAAAKINYYFHFKIPHLIAEKIILYLSYDDWVSLIKS